MANRPLPPEQHRKIHALAADGLAFEQIARALKLGIGTVSKWAKIPNPEGPHIPEVRTAQLPESLTKDYLPFKIADAGQWLVLGDIHLPYHDKKTVEMAMDLAVRRKVVGILLNGDVLDSHELSDHDKDPKATRYRQEIEIGKEMLAFIRRRHPKARIVYKLGNHDERLDTYIIRRAPALFGLEAVNVESLLHLTHYGIETCRDKRLVQLGKLNVLHGHEHRGGSGAGPVNPARGLYLKCRSVAMCGHHHRSSEHHTRNIKGDAEAAWSVGCACDLFPRWLPFNEWNHGFAFVTLHGDGNFEVENRRVLNGKVV